MKINKQDIKQAIIYYIIMILIYMASDTRDGFFDYILGCMILHLIYFVYKKRGEDPIIASKRKERKEAYEKKNTILYTTLIEGGVSYKETGVISGALLGGMFLGRIGAFLGAMLNYKTKLDKVTFCVTYKDHHTKIHSVKYNSRKYKTYMKYLRSH